MSKVRTPDVCQAAMALCAGGIIEPIQWNLPDVVARAHEPRHLIHRQRVRHHAMVCRPSGRSPACSSPSQRRRADHVLRHDVGCPEGATRDSARPAARRGHRNADVDADQGGDGLAAEEFGDALRRASPCKASSVSAQRATARSSTKGCALLRAASFISIFLISNVCPASSHGSALTRTMLRARSTPARRAIETRITSCASSPHMGRSRAAASALPREAPGLRPPSGTRSA